MNLGMVRKLLICFNLAIGIILVFSLRVIRIDARTPSPGLYNLPADAVFLALCIVMVASAVVTYIGLRQTDRLSQENAAPAQKPTQRNLVEEAQARLLAILEATPDLVAMNDMAGRVCYLNKAGRKMLGIGEDEALTRAAMGTGHLQSDAEDLLDELFPIGVDEGWRVERTLRTRDDRRVPVSQVVIVHRDTNGKIAYLSTIARDMTEHKQMDEQIQHHLYIIRQYSHELEMQKAALEQANARLELLAATDELTGLKNRRSCEERLEEEFQRSRRYGGPLSIMMLDIDHFKQFNDTFGHPVGDEVLKKVAAVLQANARATDLVARYGGEEFIIVLPQTDAQQAIEAAERIRMAVATQNWDKRPITVSIGVATKHPTTVTIAGLVAEADSALYISKALGRNLVTHNSTSQAVAV